MENGHEILLSVRNLKTYFFQDEGTVKAVDGTSFDVHAGQTLGVVGESGCGKSVTAQSILRIIERPGRIVEGEITLHRVNGDEIDLAQLRSNSREMRAVRGAEIGLVFQEPMTSFSPVHTVGNQIIEAIKLHCDANKHQARERAVEILGQVGIPRPDRRRFLVTPGCSSPMSRRLRSTSPRRLKFSTCCVSCRNGGEWRSCSSHTTWA